MLANGANARGIQIKRCHSRTGQLKWKGYMLLLASLDKIYASIPVKGLLGESKAQNEEIFVFTFLESRTRGLWQVSMCGSWSCDCD